MVPFRLAGVLMVNVGRGVKAWTVTTAASEEADKE